MDPDWCLAQAAECETLARLVSLKTDKDQLQDKARGWREKAAQAAGSSRGA